MMNPIWFAARITGLALLAAGGAYMLMKKLSPTSPDLLAGANHFRKSAEELQKGLSALFLGTPEVDQEAAKLRRESSRIVID